MVINMNYKKYSSFQILLSLFLVKFYINHIILSPFFYNLYSKTSIIILCLIYLLQPLELLIIYKLFNNNYKQYKSNHIFSIFYCIIFSSLIIYGLVSFIDSYIYSISNIYLIILGIMLPLLFNNKYHYSNIIRLVPFFFLFTFGMLIFFFFTTNDISLFAIFPNIKINNILFLIILIINITFPYILFPSIKDLSNNKFKLSTLLILGFLFSILNILLTLRQGVSLGILISEKAFPLYEVLRFLSITTYSIPLDIIFIIFLFFYSFYVLSFINSYIYHIFKINKFLFKNLITLIPFIISFIFINNLELFELIKYDILTVSAFCLVYIFISSFLSYIRSKKNV